MSVEDKEGNEMTFFQFASDHYIVAFLMFYVAFNVTGNTINRIMRHWNIHKHGYPPAHCDADGDFKPEEDK